MKAPLFWIRDYVDVDASAETVADRLRMAGVEVEGIDGDILDLEITANRADLLSMIGVAREAALAFGKPLKEPKTTCEETKERVDDVVSVETEDLSLCPRYTARVVRGVKVGSSPGWMRDKLEAAGLRPVNNIVDITNFVLLECGQPLHAFDLALLKGPKIIVRPGREIESLTAIDDKEYPLTEQDLVIADAERPVAIAGVMGGRETEVGDSTTDILIESARFDPVSVRRTSRRLGLASESSYRFERGVDWDTVNRASRRAAQLMADLAGGKVCAGVIDVAVAPPKSKPIPLRFSRVKKVLGLKIPANRVRGILKGLGCGITDAGKDKIKVKAPPRRQDLKLEIDLIEEVARVEGYDKVPSDTSLIQRTSMDRRDDLVAERVREALISMGGYEVCTWSFAEAGVPNRVPFWTKEKPVPLRDPDGNVDRLLRESLVPEFLRILAKNDSYKEHLRTIFEIAVVYFRKDGGYGEKRVLGIATPAGFSEAKGMTRRLLERLGIKSGLREDSLPHLVPGSGAVVVAGNRKIGYMGEPSGRLCGQAGLKRSAGVVELDFETLVEIADLEPKFRGFSRRPPVDRDLAVVVAEEVRWSRIETAVRNAGPPWLESVSLFDIYRGPQVPRGRKSVAFSIRFRTHDRTLRGEEVEEAVGEITRTLKSELNAVLRT